jgi:hypothetical protein
MNEEVLDEDNRKYCDKSEDVAFSKKQLPIVTMGMWALCAQIFPFFQS